MRTLAKHLAAWKAANFAAYNPPPPHTGSTLAPGSKGKCSMQLGGFPHQQGPRVRELVRRVAIQPFAFPLLDVVFFWFARSLCLQFAHTNALRARPFATLMSELRIYTARPFPSVPSRRRAGPCNRKRVQNGRARTNQRKHTASATLPKRDEMRMFASAFAQKEGKKVRESEGKKGKKTTLTNVVDIARVIMLRGNAAFRSGSKYA